MVWQRPQGSYLALVADLQPLFKMLGITPPCLARHYNRNLIRPF